MKLLTFCLVFALNHLSAQTDKSYNVFYHFEGHIQKIKTTNLDTIKNKRYQDDSRPDSFETYKSGRLNGPKKVYYDDVTEFSEYKNGKLVLQKIYNRNEDDLFYSSYLDSNTVGKTSLKLKSKRDYLNPAMTDTLEVINNNIPKGNKSITITGAGVFFSMIADNNYAIKISLLHELPKFITIKVSTLVNALAKKPVSKTETFIIPVKQ